jgi:phosphatidylserine decarboxylase
MNRIPIARGCFRYIVPPIIITLLLWYLHWIPGLIAAFLTGLLINFFRDPERKTPALPRGVLLSPADGKVISIEKSTFKDCSEYVRISIFMNIFDVHVNRVPLSGNVRSIYHYPGRFLPADNPDAPGENERMEFTLLNEDASIKVCLIAGLLARRIVTWARPDDTLLRGQRFAMIKLGSRVDVHLPETSQLLVQPGCRVKAGLTQIAILPSGSNHEK